MGRSHCFTLALFSLAFMFALGAKARAEDANATRADIKLSFGFVPAHLNLLPESALPGAWEELKGLQLNPNTALPPKLKETIALAVVAQVPCPLCVYAHRQFAKQHGASDAELNEALVMAALTRHWSTVFHGMQLDFARFKTELAQSVAHAKQLMSAPTPAPARAGVTDAKSARDDITQVFGVLPEFMQRFPDEAITGAWQEERAIEMNPNSALPAKHKSLISLAVAAQIPCRFCVLADTEFAKLAGASEREINEAIAVAALARHWSTYLNGSDLDEKAFRKDIDRMVNTTRKTAGADAANQPVLGLVRPARAPHTVGSR